MLTIDTEVFQIDSVMYEELDSDPHKLTEVK